MKIIYGISEEKYTLNGLTRTSYGVVAYADADKDGTAVIVASVRDITLDRSKLSKLVELCNKLQLSPIHLPDVIEDFVAE